MLIHMPGAEQVHIWVCVCFIENIVLRLWWEAPFLVLGLVRSRRWATNASVASTPREEESGLPNRLTCAA